MNNLPYKYFILKLMVGFLVLTAGLTSLCALALPSHACCQSSALHQSAMASCCSAQVLLQPSTSQSTAGGFDFGTLPALQPVYLLGLPDAALASTNLSRLAMRHVPDQSGRYLELRILLN